MQQLLLQQLCSAAMQQCSNAETCHNTSSLTLHCQSSSQQPGHQIDSNSNKNAETSNDAPSDINLPQPAELNSANGFLDRGSLHHPSPH